SFFVLLRFFKAKKELPLVAFFAKKNCNNPAKRLSTAIGAISVVGYQFSVAVSVSVAVAVAVTVFSFQKLCAFSSLWQKIGVAKLPIPTKNDKIQLKFNTAEKE